MFPYISAVLNLDWSSPTCGTCYKVTAGRSSVNVTAIDNFALGSSGNMHFDMAPAAFGALLGRRGHRNGHGYATF